MKNRTGMLRIVTLLLAIGVAGMADIPVVASVSPAKAEAEYFPTQKDFVGKWKLSGATSRPPRDMKTAPTAQQEADATLFQETVTTFYSAFDYLEITADGRYNFHQAGDPSGSCVWCGTWSFNKSSLWLKLDTAPRLDIYAKDGDIQMTYTAEPDKKSKYTWLVFGWTRME
ncbi:hypothetical protein D3C87_673180 [compost metagenome]|jgi:hypothetical protein|uniref:Uncharacterized protein n=1 Tax=Agrobacterium tumefaciens str. Kerr 14 TaxID=1183424 RepID=A0A1S7QHX5_AGRTU|nr:hypothetical protein [Agrobacterium tumefaciens]MCW8056101.1 hypothetical protein [Agrobacterium tumefaciens]MCW8144771.1 hypothetical protein [Agrobacterium tumefaciens]NTE91482.1 hypothetical protein [Agrobacterium tumefaciens]UXT96808.1 hypothetical protein FY129_04770 [Agrobacterium tumefaciens]CUX36825.1 conserved exported hypothetical protein [Agrobacterium tumefaciens str. Kerr 14]